MRITVILTDEDGEVFDAYCREHGHKKSTLISRLVREHLQDAGYLHQRALFQSKQEQGQEKDD